MPAIVQPSLFAINAVWCSAMSGNTQKSQRMPSLTSHGTSSRTCSSLLASIRKHLISWQSWKEQLSSLLDIMQRMCTCQVSMKLNQSCGSVMEVSLRIGCARRTRVSLASSNRVCRQFWEAGCSPSRDGGEKVHPSSWLPRPLACHRRTFFTGSVRPTLWLSRSKKNFRLQRRRRSLALILVSSMWRCMEDIEDPAATLAPVPEEPGERMASLRWYLISFQMMQMSWTTASVLMSRREVSPLSGFVALRMLRPSIIAKTPSLSRWVPLKRNALSRKSTAVFVWFAHWCMWFCFQSSESSVLQS